MGQSPGKPCSFGDGLYTPWLCTDLLVMFCQSGTNSHVHKQSTRPLPHSILDIHTDYLRNPAPEEDDSDNTQHYHCPGSVPAQVSQHDPSPSLFWQWKQVLCHCQRHGNKSTINWTMINQTMIDQMTINKRPQILISSSEYDRSLWNIVSYVFHMEW